MTIIRQPTGVIDCHRVAAERYKSPRERLTIHNGKLATTGRVRDLVINSAFVLFDHSPESIVGQRYAINCHRPLHDERRGALYALEDSRTQRPENDATLRETVIEVHRGGAGSNGHYLDTGANSRIGRSKP